ncbi:2958_t:CDS:2 [Acaulospora morrowiae]|uniref:Endopeptidase S2P n=1 Tax=Acaulospora morrowiae TaxID=94023 RepID=A0A9N9B6U7_9GLOM|nr:2958_t:CDS:2 [Acaulospora morrowiae]
MVRVDVSSVELNFSHITCSVFKMFDLILAFLGFWVVVHTFCHLIRQRFHSKQSLTNNFIRRTTNAPISLYHQTAFKPAYHISNRPFNVRFWTNVLNPRFESLANRTPKFWRIWFDVGVFVGLLTMIAGIIIMTVAGWRLLVELFGVYWKVETEFPEVQTKFVKRGFEDENSVQHEKDKSNQVFVPVIPGITLPISHFAYYLIALLICGVIHEAGHAIAAETEKLKIESTGLFLYILYPGAFVEFNLDSLERRDCRKKLRIICAGVWHNIVVFLIGYLVLNSGFFVGFLSHTAWRSVDGIGVSVVSVEEASLNTPLFDYIQPSMLITKLDDYELIESLDSWNNYLLERSKMNVNHAGFCSSERDIMSSMDCCEISEDHPYGNERDKGISCFKRIDKKKEEKVCLKTIPILVNVNEQRCFRDDDCDRTLPMCVLPYTPTGFPKPLRIYYKDAPWSEKEDAENEKVLLFLGEFEDVWEIVQVSSIQPRWSWVPLWIPESLELILRYITSFSLALCVINILPAFQLDGHHALRSLLSAYYDRSEGASTNNKSKEREKRIENGIIYFVTALVGWVVIGTLFSGLF